MSDDEYRGTDINQVSITRLSAIQGQRQVIAHLELSIRAYFNIRSASKDPNLSFGPVLLTGPSGTGKTLVAKAIHAELGNDKLIETNGETLRNKAELFSVLLTADANTTVFIDEAQGMNANAQHILLTALSEKKLYVPAGVYAMCSQTMPLSSFAIILATTHEYLLHDALRNRMRIYCRFEYYFSEDLVEIVRQRAHALKWKVESDQVLYLIAQGAKQTPRLALNRNLQTSWHVAISHDRQVITLDDVKEAFSHLQIDDQGLDKLDRSYLGVLLEHRRASLGVLSSKLSLPTYTIQRIVEPYLLKEGLILKDGSARIITQKGLDYIQNT